MKELSIFLLIFCVFFSFSKSEIQEKPTQKSISICNHLANYIKKSFINDKNIESLNLISYCEEKFPSEFIKECQNISNKYSKKMIQKITENEDPCTVCPLNTIESENELDLNDEKQNFSFEISQKHFCHFCLEITQSLRTLISEQSQKKSLTQRSMGRLCDLFTDQETSFVCQAFIKTKLESVLEKIFIDLNPENICKKYELCE
ncbi:granulysin related [Anaeramoeba ignava]|uniref:Granulysin related n=1 Tax=Anaeramoeba ignava TaxID=1746090 RepID=A0A9Q0LW76_ANAIG|nr:granulysin related [Anaeramoeba ignava]